MTIDGGQNITLHGSTNIGPWWTSEKYNLNVFGDVTVGAVLPIDPESATNDVNVQGSVTTSKLILRDARTAGVRASE